jgi:glycosyltransferase domain-containing protein
MEYEKNILKKLTIVIPTFNRQDYLIRNMSYWSNREAKIIIIDGSIKSIPQKTIKNFGLNIQYIHYPAPMIQRIDKSRSLIKTEYVALLGDDEFFLTDGLLASIKELDRDPSLVACMGRALGFINYKKNLIKGFFVYTSFKNYCVSADKSSDRMKDHMKNYAPSTIYSVVRAREWKAAFEASSLHEFPVYGAVEIQFELAMSYFGKSKIIPVLHWLRSFEQEPIRENLTNDVSLDTRNKFYDWWLSSENYSNREKFIQITSRVLAKYNNRKVNQVAQEVKRALDIYSKTHIKKTFSLKTTLRRIINNALPISLIKKIRIFKYEFQNSFTNSFRLSNCAQKLHEDGVNVNFYELSEIEKIILKFHNN